MSSHIPIDLQMQIIERLPVESLIRFRSVCKAWKSLIDSSEFIAGYNGPQTQPQHLLIRYVGGSVDETDEELKYVSFVDDDTFPQQKFSPTFPTLLQVLNECTIIGSSSGLLCFHGFSPESDGSSTEMAVLWNPSIRKSIVVVGPNVVHPDQEPDNVIGFGVCPDTKDPKLVNITYINDNDQNPCCQVMVFTLSSREWRCLSSNQLPRISLEFYNSCQITIGGFIYWAAYDPFALLGELYLILSFDLSTDEFREVRLPGPFWQQSDPSISRLRDSLVLLDYKVNSTTEKKVCDVWMMEHGDPKTFTKLFTIKPPHASVLSTLEFRNNGEPIIGMQYDDNENYYVRCAFVVYEPCLENIKDLGILGYRHSLYGSSYTKSLLLLDHDDGHIVKCGAVKS